MGQSYSFCIWEFFHFSVPSAIWEFFHFSVPSTCIKSLHILILLHANHYSKLLISHCMQLVSYLFVLLAYYYIPYAFGATTKFALKCVSLLLNLFIDRKSVV